MQDSGSKSGEEGNVGDDWQSPSIRCASRLRQEATIQSDYRSSVTMFSSVWRAPCGSVLRSKGDRDGGRVDGIYCRTLMPSVLVRGSNMA